MTDIRAIPGTGQLSGRDGLQALWALRHGMAGLYEALELARDRLGEAFQLGFGRFQPVVISGPEALREALVERRDSLSWRSEGDPVARLFGRSILVTDGEEHDRARAVMAPAFTPERLRAHVPAMVEAVDRELARWPREGRVEVVSAMRRIAWRNFERAFFSHDLGDAELRHLWPALLAALRYIGPGPWVVTGRAGRPPAKIRPLEEHLLGLIRTRRAGGSRADDLLGLLVGAFEDDRRVRDHALTMLIAGHDTSTAQLSWALHLLARSPEWLARATREVRGVLGNGGLPEAGTDLPVVEAVLKEALRLWPPIHLGARRATEDVVLGGWPVPRGSRVLLSYFLVQRDATRWERANGFDPGRWLGSGAPGAFTYLPFGGGPRNCIGAGFANLEGRVVLARLLQRADFAVTRRPLRGAMGATLEPRGGKLLVRAR